MRDPAALSHPEFQHLLRELEAMGRQQFEQFLLELEKLRARKTPPLFDEEEQRIIDRIKTGGFSQEDRYKFKTLSELSTTDKLSAEEENMLEQLLEQLNKLSLKTYPGENVTLFKNAAFLILDEIEMHLPSGQALPTVRSKALRGLTDCSFSFFKDEIMALV